MTTMLLGGPSTIATSPLNFDVPNEAWEEAATVQLELEARNRILGVDARAAKNARMLEQLQTTEIVHQEALRIFQEAEAQRTQEAVEEERRRIFRANARDADVARVQAADIARKEALREFREAALEALILLEAEVQRAREAELAARRAEREAVVLQEASHQFRIGQVEEVARRAREAEQEAQRIDITKDKAAVTIQHVVFDFTIGTFGAGLDIQDILTGFESCRIRIRNLPLDATHNDVRALFTQQGIKPGLFHVVGMKRSLDGKQEAEVIGHKDLKPMILALEGTDLKLGQLLFDISPHSGDLRGSTASNANTQCPICHDDVSCPVQLGCGHTYCTGCIRHFFTSASTFPLTCLGNDNQCGAPIPIPTIQHLLLPQQVTNLLETAVVTHIEHFPQDFKYCTTPDCRQIYRCSKSETAPIIHCPSCLSAVCPSCHEEGHEGMTCTERRIQNDPAEQERLNNELARQLGFKKCPQCTVWIEKTEGCNHVACRCGAHICWVCLGVFNAGSVYDHMQTVHGAVDDVVGEAIEAQDLAEQREVLRLAEEQLQLREAQAARPRRQGGARQEQLRQEQLRVEEQRRIRRPPQIQADEDRVHRQNILPAQHQQQPRRLCEVVQPWQRPADVVRRERLLAHYAQLRREAEQWRQGDIPKEQYSDWGCVTM